MQCVQGLGSHNLFIYVGQNGTNRNRTVRHFGVFQVSLFKQHWSNLTPEGTLGYVTCALAANSTKRRKKMGSSVAYKTIGTFLSQNKRHEDTCG